MTTLGFGLSLALLSVGCAGALLLVGLAAAKVAEVASRAIAAADEVSA